MKSQENRIQHHSGARTVIGVLVSILCLFGCATTIAPPNAPKDPRIVILLDHGRHTSLGLTQANGDLIRYSYGDWRFYALSKKTAAGAISVLFTPTAAAMGRRELKGPPTEETIRKQLRINLVYALFIEVESEAVDSLIAELDELFEANRDTLVYNETQDHLLVRNPTPYTLNHNCNSVVADWLRALGCEVRGEALISSWRLAGAKNPPRKYPHLIVKK